MNSLRWTLLAAPCMALAAFTTSSQSGLPQAGGTALNTPAPDNLGELGDAQGWRARLQNKDLAARESEFEVLLERAGASDAARAQLEQWAGDTKHVDFAWTCRLALRELKARAKSMASPSVSDDPFEALRQGIFPGGQGADPFDGFFMLPFAQTPGAGRGMRDPFLGFPKGLQSQSQSDGFSLEMGPDGVKAKVKTRVDGEEHEEQYTAKSLDELLLAHPELKARIGGGTADGASGFRFGLPGFALERPPLMRTDVLGVYIAKTDSANSATDSATDKATDASSAEGLRVERVQPGSLAERLGLEAGFVLTTLNGHALKTRDDISSALRERKPDQELRVEYLDRDGAHKTATFEPSKDTRGGAQPLQPQGLTGTRKI